jgi:hypothetical protein
VVAEGQAFPAKAIKIGSFEEGVAPLRPHQVGDKICSPLINDDKQDIFSGHVGLVISEAY